MCQNKEDLLNAFKTVCTFHNASSGVVESQANVRETLIGTLILMKINKPSFKNHINKSF